MLHQADIRQCSYHTSLKVITFASEAVPAVGQQSLRVPASEAERPHLRASRANRTIVTVESELYQM
jgi:hypothetical protein